jgi:cytoskeletal protein CcmA (bactofilin family)
MFKSGGKSVSSARASTAHTLISTQTEFDGDIRFAGELIIEGTVRGNIYAEDESGAVLRVTETGVVEGEVCVPTVVVNGLVKGDVHSAKHLELAAKAVVMGSIYYQLIEMVMGSEVNGSLLHLARTQQDAKRLSGSRSKVLSYDVGDLADATTRVGLRDETIVD